MDNLPFTYSPNKVYKEDKTTRKGLTQPEAELRLKRDGLKNTANFINIFHSIKM